MKRVATVVLASAAILALAATTMAQQPIEYKVEVKGELVKGAPGDHFLTFTGPVHVPDVTLPAGTYVFSIVAPSVMQVTSADRKELYAMFFTVPADRPDTADKYEVEIVQPNPTAPGRIAKWYLPNQQRGYEFLYPAAEGR